MFQIYISNYGHYPSEDSKWEYNLRRQEEWRGAGQERRRGEIQEIARGGAQAREMVGPVHFLQQGPFEDPAGIDVDVDKAQVEELAPFAVWRLVGAVLAVDDHRVFAERHRATDDLVHVGFLLLAGNRSRHQKGLLVRRKGIQQNGQGVPRTYAPHEVQDVVESDQNGGDGGHGRAGAGTGATPRMRGEEKTQHGLHCYL